MVMKSQTNPVMPPSSTSNWRERLYQWIDLVSGCVGFLLALVCLSVSAPAVWAGCSLLGLCVAMGAYQLYVRHGMGPSSPRLPQRHEGGEFETPHGYEATRNFCPYPLFLCSCTLLLVLALFI